MRWLAVFSLWLISAEAGFGQQTWQDLVFGSRLSQVEQTTGKKGWQLKRLEGPSMMYDSPSGHQEYEVAPDFDVKASTSKIPFHFTPNLLFAPADQLQRITLRLNTKRHNEEQVDAPLLTVIAAKAIQTALAERYGTPLTKSGICDAVSSGDVSGGRGAPQCTCSWIAEKQRITLDWGFYSGNKLLLSISYERIVPSGL
jgi:hypothetical protein